MDPEQRLLLVEYEVGFRFGANELAVAVAERGPYAPGFDVQLEKAELRVEYA